MSQFKQKTINSLFPDGTIDQARYDKEVSEFLAKIGESLADIKYSSAAFQVNVAQKGGIQHLGNNKVVTVTAIINSTYILYTEPDSPLKTT